MFNRFELTQTIHVPRFIGRNSGMLGPPAQVHPSEIAFLGQELQHVGPLADRLELTRVAPVPVSPDENVAVDPAESAFRALVSRSEPQVISLTAKSDEYAYSIPRPYAILMP